MVRTHWNVADEFWNVTSGEMRLSCSFFFLKRRCRGSPYVAFLLHCEHKKSVDEKKMLTIQIRVRPTNNTKKEGRYIDTFSSEKVSFFFCLILNDFCNLLSSFGKVSFSFRLILNDFCNFLSSFGKVSFSFRLILNDFCNLLSSFGKVSFSFRLILNDFCNFLSSFGKVLSAFENDHVGVTNVAILWYIIQGRYCLACSFLLYCFKHNCSVTIL